MPWVQFSGGMENFNLATAQESQRDGHWLMPYLGLQPRAKKPPLVHWITALGIELIPGSLAWGARGPSILVSCALLLAVYEMGRSLEDWPLGLVGAFVSGSTLLFLKFAWQASYDLHLALWVTVCNWQLARATFQGRRWSGCLLAGAALGLALMTKGPPAILQTVIPWGVFLAWRRWRWNQWAGAGWFAPLLGGLAVMLAISLPWTVYAFWVNRNMLGMAYNEVSLGTEAAYETRVRWYSYIVFFPMMLPWLIWFLSGFIEAARAGRKSQALWLAIFWLVLPIAVMTWFPERRDRYLLPMLGPAALLAAHGVLRHVPRWGAWTGLQRWLLSLHGAIVAVIAVGLPILGRRLTRADGAPWYTAHFAASMAAVAAIIWICGLLIYRKTRVGFVAGTVALMLLANSVFLWGYKDSASGRSSGKILAADILGPYPDAQVYNADPRRRPMLPLELLIYLNRDVPPLDDPSSLAPSSKPQVLIYPPDDANPAPPGFTEIAERKINTGVYRAFVRQKGRP